MSESPNIQSKKCRTCDHWNSAFREIEYAHTKGSCKRHPPYVIHDGSTVWPETSGYDHCGDWKQTNEVISSPQPVISKPKRKPMRKLGEGLMAYRKRLLSLGFSQRTVNSSY